MNQPPHIAAYCTVLRETTMPCNSMLSSLRLHTDYLKLPALHRDSSFVRLLCVLVCVCVLYHLTSCETYWFSIITKHLFYTMNSDILLHTLYFHHSIPLFSHVVKQSFILDRKSGVLVHNENAF